jgi:hypothetical protein
MRYPNVFHIKQFFLIISIKWLAFLCRIGGKIAMGLKFTIVGIVNKFATHMVHRTSLPKLELWM